ncbi:MAG: hypothetical protein IIY88_07595, partial [Eubacterium sp.]|nr:hypothetical protein [Eubacterium sp.]
PIVVSKAGTLEIAAATNITGDQYVWAELYRDAACSGSPISGTTLMLQGQTADDAFVALAAGTYYMKVYKYSDDVCTCRIVAGVWPSGDKVIASGQTMAYYVDSSRIKDFKYTATANGKIRVACASDYGYHVQILSASKGVLSEERWLTKGTGCDLAVEKGKTYFIRVKSIDSNTVLQFSLKQTAVKEKSGKSKKKAVAIKAKKKAKGTIAPGSKKADWYKLTLKKKKTLTINLTTDATNYLTLTVYNKKGKKIGSTNIYNATKWKGTVTHSRTYGKADKGTYYIKISRKTAKDSGIYTLSWK